MFTCKVFSQHLDLVVELGFLQRLPLLLLYSCLELGDGGLQPCVVLQQPRVFFLDVIFLQLQRGLFPLCLLQPGRQLAQLLLPLICGFLQGAYGFLEFRQLGGI